MEEKEEWRDVVGYEGEYRISNNGRIFNVNRNRVQSESKHNKGYLTGYLIKNKIGKNLLLHRLVAISFIDNPLNLDQINHIDGDKTNNNVLNLEWCNNSQNQIHRVYTLGSKPSIPMVPVIQIMKSTNLIVGSFPSYSEAHRLTGISASSISNNVNGRASSAGGFRWERSGN